MPERPELPISPKDMERLRGELEELRRRNVELERERDRLHRENADLREKLELQARELHRQAAPFRIPESKRVKNPRSPGRKAGHPGACRRRPAHVDEDVAVPLECCPHCGGTVENCQPVEQFIEDVPDMRPQVTRLVTYSGDCARCGRVATRHPRQLSRATGAAATQVGPRALSIAVDLNKRLGLPLRKTCDVLAEHFGIRLTAGALAQAEARLAARLEPTYREILDLLRTSPVVYTDETSWWVNGSNRWLWVFTSRELTLYVVDHRRNVEVVKETLGKAFGGVLSSDCLNIYDTLVCTQNKCYAHHLKAIGTALEDASGDGRWLLQLRNLLVTAIALGKIRSDVPVDAYARFVESLERRADELLAAATGDADAAKVVARLQRQRDHLFTFLRFEGVDPTNNAAERGLRPAVVARKISCGNRSDRGRRTWQTLATLSATCGQKRASFARAVARALPMTGPTGLVDLTGPPAGLPIPSG